MPTKQSIPIYGIDTRPLARQQALGVCKQITNLRPDGPEDDPHWVPVARPNPLYEYQRPDIVRMSAYKDYFVVLTEDYKIQLLDPSLYIPGDPDGDPPTGPVTDPIIRGEYTLDGDPEDTFAIDAVETGDIGVVSVTKNGAPYRTFFLDESQPSGERFVLFDYPELPIIKLFTRLTKESYTLDEIAEGVHEGLDSGLYYWRYAFRFGSGNHVMHSKPIPFRINKIGLSTESGGGAEEYYFNKLLLYFEGFQQIDKPEGFDFWNKVFSGVSVFLSPRITDDRDDVPGVFVPPINPARDLRNLQFYEIGYFPFIEYDKTPEDPDYAVEDFRQTYEGKTEDIVLGDSMEVDNYSHHKVTGQKIFSYNARSFIGGTSTDFAAPRLSPFDSIYYTQLKTSRDFTDDTIKVDFFNFPERSIDIRDLTITLQNLSIINKNADYITADIEGEPFSMDILYAPEDLSGSELPFQVSLDQDDLSGEYIPYSKFTTPPSARKLAVQVEVGFDIPNRSIKRLASAPTPVFTGPDQVNGGATFNRFFPIGGFLFYPDNRVDELRMYGYKEGSDEWGKDTGELVVSTSDTINGAIGTLGYNEGVPVSFPAATPSTRAVHKKLYSRPNRLIASETNRPYSYQPENTYYIGTDNNEIRGFGVNSLPISEGQFGQYPLYVFTGDEIWALQQGGDPRVAFSNLAPVSLSHGLDSAGGIANIGRSLGFVYNKQIYTIGGGSIREIGRPVEDLLSGSEQLAYYNTDGNEELWVVGEENILAYNLEYGRWFSIDRAIKNVAIQGNKITSVDAAGNFYDEYGLSGNDVDVSIELQPIHYGLPDSLKRLYWLSLRAQMKTLSLFSIAFERTGQQFTATGNRIRPRHPSDFSYSASISGRMTPGSPQYIHRLDSEFDVRYGRQSRQNQTTPQ